MKIFAIATCCLGLLTSGWALPVAAKAAGGGNYHSVKGYSKKNGTYVQPHQQTNPNQTQRDNWSSKPNTNPYTGAAGQKEPRK